MSYKRARSLVGRGKYEEQNRLITTTATTAAAAAQVIRAVNCVSRKASFSPSFCMREYNKKSRPKGRLVETRFRHFKLYTRSYREAI